MNLRQFAAMAAALLVMQVSAFAVLAESQEHSGEVTPSVTDSVTESDTGESTPGSVPDGSSSEESKPDESLPESKPDESLPESKPDESLPESKPEESKPDHSSVQDSSSQSSKPDTSSASDSSKPSESVSDSHTGDSSAADSSKPDSSSEEDSSSKVTEPSLASLEVGSIKDGRFDVKLNIFPEARMTGAVIKVEYDSSVITLTDSETHSQASGGSFKETRSDGSYKLTFINTDGTSYRGAYADLSFKVVDKEVSSSVIYIAVESMEDMSFSEMPTHIQNGIVRLREDETVSGTESSGDSAAEASKEDERPIIKVRLTTMPLTLEELGVPDIKNVRNVRLGNTDLAYYEQGAVFLLMPGETELVVRYISGKELKFRLIISEAARQTEAAVSDNTSSSSETEADTSGRNFFIAVAVLLTLAAIALEYIFIMKPFNKKPPKKEEPQEEFVAYDDDNAPEMVQDPEEVFARKKKPARRNGQDEPKRRNADRPKKKRK